jgi:hypothetical protein
MLNCFSSVAASFKAPCIKRRLLVKGIHCVECVKVIAVTFDQPYM